MAAIANEDMAMHAQAVDALALRLDEGAPGDAADDSGDERAAGDDQEQLEAERERVEMSAVPRKICVNRLAVSGVIALRHDQAGERERDVEPQQRGQRRR